MKFAVKIFVGGEITLNHFTRFLRTFVFALVFQLGATARVWFGDPVLFSGQVKKILTKKSKIGIKNPETKKRFTLVINEESNLKGYRGIQDVKKGDSVLGKS